MINDIYKICPTYETDMFRLRLVKIEDAENLLTCYSDKQVSQKANIDYCTSDFYCTTVEEMEECIRFWLKEYSEQRYVRFAIILKTSNKAVGTLEIFGGEEGILRIDIATSYEKYVEELFKLAVFKLIKDFNIKSLKIKASNIPDRISVLEKYGFVPSATFRSELGYYERPVYNFFDESKGVAYCGLACCVCSENANCKGCRNNGCKDKNWCKSYNCCKTKKLNGCWECEQFPCDYSMLGKLRVKTFAKFIAENGADKLISKLKINEENGILYHHREKLVGDYDLFENEDHILDFLNG